MEDSLENWISHLETEMDEDDFFDQRHISSFQSFDEQKFLNEILNQPADFSPECGSPSPHPSSTTQNNTAAAAIADGVATSPTTSSVSCDETSFDGHGTLHKSSSMNSIISLEKPTASSPTTYILSFDKSSVERATLEPCSKHDSTLGGSLKRTKGSDVTEARGHQAAKKLRSSSETQVHILAERKRRQELTGSIIALAATIPGLKKMDKAYVLREAVKYVKQLQERVTELQSQSKDRKVDSPILISKSQASSMKSTTSCETNSNSGSRFMEALPEVEAKVLEKEVLIGIRCEKQKDTVHKILVLLEKLHLSIASSSVLPFGASLLIVTIIAQMDERYRMTMDELRKNLRQDLMELHDKQQ